MPFCRRHSSVFLTGYFERSTTQLFMISSVDGLEIFIRFSSSVFVLCLLCRLIDRLIVLVKIDYCSVVHILSGFLFWSFMVCRYLEILQWASVIIRYTICLPFCSSILHPIKDFIGCLYLTIAGRICWRRHLRRN